MISRFPHPPNAPTQRESRAHRVLTLTSLGVSEQWLEREVDPICLRLSDHLHRTPPLESLEDLMSGERDGDLFLVGCEGAEDGGLGALVDTVAKICRAHPLESVLAIAPGPSDEVKIALFRAGAVDVLSPNEAGAPVEQAVVQAFECVQARRNQCDQEKLRVVSQLAVSVNHEINNPLTGLMGTVELMLLENQGLKKKFRLDLEVIIEQSRRIQEVTQRLKTLNHIRTVPYGEHDMMIDLIGELHPEAPPQVIGDISAQFLTPMRLLIVDDNPLIIDLVSRLFEQRFNVDAAAYASDALSKVEATAYDLILSDLILPEMNGLELYRAIRRLRPGQKVLLTTAYRGDPRVEQAIIEGALGCIYKPFKLEELEQAFTDALKSHSA